MMIKDELIEANDPTIQKGSKVSLHFALKLVSGDIVDSNFKSQPANLILGDGNLPEGFEHCLLGLKVGDHKSFSIPPENAFGQHNSSNMQPVARNRFAPDMELEEGLVVSFGDSAGGELPGVIKSHDEQSVTVDFNHPLAGQTLTFEVEIFSVLAAE